MANSTPTTGHHDDRPTRNDVTAAEPERDRQAGAAAELLRQPRSDVAADRAADGEAEAHDREHQAGSGLGNHFVEFGIVEVMEHDEILNVPAGKYLGLLSHSG